MLSVNDQPVFENQIVHFKKQDMENFYTVHTKLLDGKTYYFVKKHLKLTEFKDAADLLVGYGMHSDFDKACGIAGISDMIIKEQLLSELENRKKVQRLPMKRLIKIPETVNRWLADSGAEVLN